MTASADPCPSTNAIGDQWYSYEGVNSSKVIDNSADTTTYNFWSTEDRDSTNGIPGLIELCVYTSPQPSSQDPTPSNWKDAQATSDVFGFVRKTGQDNIHFDGDVHEVGVASWNSNPPTNQTILLHIIDSVACGMSGQTVNTCWVYPWGDLHHRRTPPPELR